jgi:peptidoglycan hydrolase-like protein with peptidoglycan-binding domain
MIFSLTWLPSLLRNAGLKIAPVDGWESRGRAEMGQVVGVICHHTGGGPTGNMPSLRVLIEGRSDLPGPLAQLGLGRDGTYYVIAAGRCNHAGAGIWQGFSNGNGNFIGIEAEHTGRPADPWPAVQIDAYQRGVAAILRHVGRGPEFCAGHKEYAKPAGRKPDPSFDMNVFRSGVEAFMNGTAPVPTLIPPVEPAGSNGTGPRPTIRRGQTNDFVRGLQTKLGLPADGVFGPLTEAAVREFQRQHALVPDGIVGPKSWRVLDGLP